MNRKTLKLLLILPLIISTFILVSCVPVDPNQEFEVSFYVDDVLVKTESVKYGEEATAPETPVKEHYTFLSWDKNFTNVKSKLKVNAIFVPIRYTINATNNITITVVRESQTFTLTNNDTVVFGEELTITVKVLDNEEFDSLVINDETYPNNAKYSVNGDLTIIGKTKEKAAPTNMELIQEDYDALVSTFGSKKDDFALPVVGSKGSVITWTVKTGTSVVINNNQAIVTRPEEIDEVVILIAKLSIGDDYLEKEVSVTIQKAEKVPTNMELLQEDYAELFNSFGNKKADFDLPISGSNGSNISWTVKSGLSVEIINNQAVVTRPEGSDEVVILLARLTIGTDYLEKEVSVNIQKAEVEEELYATDLFISEYAEGQVGNNKYIEIFNGTGANVSLRNYSIKLYSNGGVSPSYIYNFDDIILPHGLLVVIYNSGSSADILNSLPSGLSFSHEVTYFNGDDAVGLYKNDELIDLIGVIGTDPGTEWTGTDAYGNALSTMNQTLVRYSGTYSPNPVFTPEEWVTYGTDIFTTVGEHDFEFIKLTPAQIIEADYQSLSITSQTVSNIDLPEAGFKGSTITWQSMSPDIISDSGVVNRQEHDEFVTMVATISYEGEFVTKEFIVKVLALNTTPVMAYYAGVDGLVGDALESALRQIITSTHKTKISYKSLNSYFAQTDADPSNPTRMLLFYTGLNAASHSWNKEHVWPDSKGGNSAENDLHHIRPTVSSVNSARSNYTIGYVTSNKKEIVYSGVGTGNYTGGNMFEPADRIKGDVARIIFYCATRYSNLDIVSSNVAKLNTLLEWNMMDQPDELEMYRNEAIFNIQGNRNPFIDYPEFANLIWG